MADIRINALATTAASTASDDFIAIDGSANGTRKLDAYSPTFGGNLTVSGTGQSSIGGYLSINSALAGSTYGRLISGTTTAGLPAFFATNAVNASLVIDFPSSFVARIRTNSASEVLAFAIGTTERARFETTGNLLLGTTTDSGNGKLQLATHTTSAGGIGFGTDVSVYRSGTRELTFLGASSSTFVFAGTALGSTIALKLGDGTNNDQGVIESQAGSLVFKRNAFTALTLDASQNIVPGTAALATSATNGFIYLQTCAGAPTGVPTSYTGRVASIYDTTNNKLYIYNGGWKSVTLT